MAHPTSFALSGPGPRDRRLWVGLLIAAVLLQLALFAYAAGPGLAGTSDSHFYLHAAQTFRDTGHLRHPDGTAYRYWPPLYPVLLRVASSLAGIRGLQGASLLGSLLLWSWLGRQLLPTRRALALPALLALSTPWLLVGKFVWAESVFLLLFAAYAAALFQWLRTAAWQWWAAATLLGLLLPLQRTLGIFLLMGVGTGLLLSVEPNGPLRRRWLLLIHLALSAAGGVLWQWHALLAGPSRYHPSRGWGQLLSSGADYGFVLGRWLLPLPTAGRTLLSNAAWAGVLLALFGLLWPLRPAGGGALLSTKEVEAHAFKQPIDDLPRQAFLRMLWGVSVSLVALVAGLTVFAQSAAGIHDAERYASVLFGPVLVLALAAWPARVPGWLGRVLLAAWLLSAALRVGHVARDLRALAPLPADSFPGPAPHGQRVGAAGE